MAIPGFNAARSVLGAGRSFPGTTPGKAVGVAAVLGGTAFAVGCGRSEPRNTEAVAGDLLSRFGNGDDRIQLGEGRAHRVREVSRQCTPDGSYFPMTDNYTSHSSVEKLVRAADRNGDGADASEISKYMLSRYDKGDANLKKDDPARNNPNGTLEGDEWRAFERDFGDNGYESWDTGRDPYFQINCDNAGAGHRERVIRQNEQDNEDRSGNWGREGGGNNSDWRDTSRNERPAEPRRAPPPTNDGGGRRPSTGGSNWP